MDEGEALVHGNEILALHVTDYDKTKRFAQQDHTLENIHGAVRKLFADEAAEAAFTQLASYLVLDGLIGNTDRHHENWGLRTRVDAKQMPVQLTVAPSFDHASSLGRELLDARRSALLTAGRVGYYVMRGRGGVFLDAAQRHGENPLRLVQRAARAYPRYFCPALQRVAELRDDTIKAVFAALPAERASDVAQHFALQVVFYAKTFLSKLLP